MKKIVILGSTGSIGVQALDVIGQNPNEFNILGLAAGKNFKLLNHQVRKFQPRYYYLSDNHSENKLPNDNKMKANGLVQLATLPDADLVLIAIPGIVGLWPTLKAIQAGKTVAIASKEILYVAGEIVMEEARRSEVTILPVDSEPGAIWQCVVGEGHNKKDHHGWIHDDFSKMPIRRLILTASGGSLRDVNVNCLELITPNDVLNHPTWRMGDKVTFDSATMLNKGMEVVEAHWLFGCFSRTNCHR